MKGKEILALFEHIDYLLLPEGLIEAARDNEDLPYINTCGYAIASAHSITPNKFGDIDFLPCCVIHDWRRWNLAQVESSLQEKIVYDNEFMDNMLTTINQADLTNEERVAIVELAFLYYSSVMSDEIVDGKSFLAKLWNVIKVLWLVLWFPVQSFVRLIKVHLT